MPFTARSARPCLQAASIQTPREGSQPLGIPSCRVMPGTGLAGMHRAKSPVTQLWECETKAPSLAPLPVCLSPRRRTAVPVRVDTASSAGSEVGISEASDLRAQEQKQAHERDVVVLEQMLQKESAEKASLSKRLSSLELLHRELESTCDGSICTDADDDSDIATVIMQRQLSSECPLCASSDADAQPVEFES